MDWQVTKKVIICIMLLCSLFTQAQQPSWGDADTYQRSAQEAMNHVKPLSSSELRHFDAVLKNSEKHKAQFLALSNKANQRVLQNNNPYKNARGVMIFASLGMPELSLKQLMLQAQRLRVPVVIRGVLPQGFSATIKRLSQLINIKENEKKLDGVAINPNWFKQFNVKQVPAFVAVKDGACLNKQPCRATDYDIIYGNVSVDDALTRIVSHGDAKSVALRYINQGASYD